MHKIVWLWSIILTLSFVPLAGAQLGKTSGPKFYSDFKPVVGGWSEYQVATRGTQQVRTEALDLRTWYPDILYSDVLVAAFAATAARR